MPPLTNMQCGAQSLASGIFSHWSIMSARIIDGVAISRAILDEIKSDTASFRNRHGQAPGLATILVGGNPASLSYVTRKARTALELGFHEVQDNPPENVREEDLLALIGRHNADPAIHGILVQLPLPSHINEKRVIMAIRPEKDVDGFHPLNMGKVLLGAEDAFAPCTPSGICELLLREKVQTAGAEVVIVGRSNIVGKPLAAMLSGKGANATVTLVHTGTKDMAGHCRRADILVVAAGAPALVKADWIKPGAAVIDVGVNRVGLNEKSGRAILAGDVDFQAARAVAGLITPVPGGVGPMTIAMLMKNVLLSARLHLES